MSTEEVDLKEEDQVRLELEHWPCFGNIMEMPAACPNNLSLSSQFFSF